MVSFLFQPLPPTQKEDLISWKLGLVLWTKQHRGAWEEAVLSHWPFFVSSGPLPSLEDESLGILGSQRSLSHAPGQDATGVVVPHAAGLPSIPLLVTVQLQRHKESCALAVPRCSKE